MKLKIVAYIIGIAAWAGVFITYLSHLPGGELGERITEQIKLYRQKYLKPKK